MLTQTLRDLEREGYVNRTVHPEVSVRVEYVLTKLGRELVKPLYELVCWADEHQEEVKHSRKVYDEKINLVSKLEWTLNHKHLLHF